MENREIIAKANSIKLVNVFSSELENYFSLLRSVSSF